MASEEIQESIMVALADKVTTFQTVVVVLPFLPSSVGFRYDSMTMYIVLESFCLFYVKNQMNDEADYFRSKSINLYHFYHISWWTKD